MYSGKENKPLNDPSFVFMKKIDEEALNEFFKRIRGSSIRVLEPRKKVFFAHHKVIEVYTFYCLKSINIVNICKK